jgi:hypothetical protein
MAFKKTIKFNGKEIVVHDFTFVHVENPTLLTELLDLEDESRDKDDIEIWSNERANELLSDMKDRGNVSELDIEEFAENIKLLEVGLVDCVVVMN